MAKLYYSVPIKLYLWILEFYVIFKCPDILFFFWFFFNLFIMQNPFLAYQFYKRLVCWIWPLGPILSNLASNIENRTWINVLFCKFFTTSSSSHSLNQTGWFLPRQQQCALSQSLFPSKEQLPNADRLIRRNKQNGKKKK